MKIYVAIAAAALLSACVPSQAIVSDYNGASVKIQTSQLANGEENKAKAQQEADRVCATGKKRAEYASTINKPDYVSEHLFMCL